MYKKQIMKAKETVCRQCNVPFSIGNFQCIVFYLRIQEPQNSRESRHDYYWEWCGRAQRSCNAG